MPIHTYESWVWRGCQAYTTRRFYEEIDLCDAGIHGSVVFFGVRKVSKEQRIARQEAASEALQRLKTHGWKAEDSDIMGKDDTVSN